MDVSTDGDVWYAEPTGAGLEPSATDIDKIEQRIAVLGLSLLVKQTRTGQVTATEERNDQIEESSDLSTWVENLKDAVELALKFHAQYLSASATTGGNVELGASLDDVALTPEEMTAWSNAVAGDQFSRETMWEVFAAGGKLPPSFDKKVEADRIAEQQQAKADLAEIALRKFNGDDGSD